MRPLPSSPECCRSSSALSVILCGEHPCYPKIAGMLREGAQEHPGRQSCVRDPVPCWMQVRSPSSARQDGQCSAPACPAAQPCPPCSSLTFSLLPCNSHSPADLSLHSSDDLLPLPSTLLVFPFCCPKVSMESSFLLCLQPLSLHCHLSAPSPAFPVFGRQREDTEKMNETIRA